MEVVDHLGEQPHAVDGVDGPEAPPGLEPRVAEEGLHDPLAVVERSLDRDAVHVRVRHGGHLKLLEAARPPLREQDEDPHVRLAAERGDRGAAGVAARRAEDVQGLAGAPELVVEEMPEELEGEVLEGEGRPVEQLQEVEVSERRERCDFRGVEPAPAARGGVAPFDERAKVLLRHVVREAAEDLEGERRIGEPPPRFELPGHVREAFRHQEPAISRLPGHEGRAERDGRPPASRAHVSHGGKCIRSPAAPARRALGSAPGSAAERPLPSLESIRLCGPPTTVQRRCPDSRKTRRFPPVVAVPALPAATALSAGNLAVLGPQALAAWLAPLAGPGPWAAPTAPRARNGAQQAP